MSLPGLTATQWHRWGLNPRPFRSQVKHSTTEPLRSLIWTCIIDLDHLSMVILDQNMWSIYIILVRIIGQSMSLDITEIIQSRFILKYSQTSIVWSARDRRNPFDNLVVRMIENGSFQIIWKSLDAFKNVINFNSCFPWNNQNICQSKKMSSLEVMASSSLMLCRSKNAEN